MKSSATAWRLPRVVLPSLATNLLEMLGRRIRVGQLHVTLPDGSTLCFTGAEDPGLVAHWHIRRYRSLWRVMTRGATGFAEAYLAGDWDTPDLQGLLLLAARNDNRLGTATSGIGIARLVERARHWMKTNSPRQAQRNIAYHYDLGNAFYGLWLDETMTYSSAVYADGAETLADAQRAKYERLFTALGIAPGQNVLEIGCGWGGFLEHAARAREAHYTGISISREQCQYATARLAAAGLAERAKVEFRDYRDVVGQYDRIASIEMFEAVGEAYWDTYAQTVKRLLKPGGVAALQVITIEPARFPTYRRSPDFIQRYIFPGGMLPTPEILVETFARAGLRLTDSFSFGHDYARTLAEWRVRFDSAWPEIAALGFDERFRRMWHMYLAYCEAGFLTDSVDVVQIRLEHA